MKTGGSLSPRERRIVKLGAAIVAMALVGGRAVPAWVAWVGAGQDRASRAVSELAEAHKAVRETGAARDTLRARNERYLTLAPALIGGTSPATAGASLALLVSARSAAAGLELGALRVTVDSAREGVFARISVRGDARGDIRGLTAMLLSLEQGPVLLAIRQLSISASDPGGPADRAEALRMEFLIDGLTIDQRAVRDVQPSAVPARVPLTGDSSR